MISFNSSWTLASGPFFKIIFLISINPLPLEIKMHLELLYLFIFDHFSIFVTEIGDILGSLRIMRKQHSHRLQRIQLFFRQFQHFHLVHQILVHLVQLVLEIVVFCHDVDFLLVCTKLLEKYWGAFLPFTAVLEFTPVFKLPFFI